MSIDTVEMQNNTTAQTVTSTQPVTVVPATDQPVKTTAQGAATIEAAVAEDLQRNPSAILIGAGVVLLFGLVVFGLCLHSWVADNNPRAGQVVQAVADPLGVVVAFLLGLVTTPPKSLSR